MIPVPEDEDEDDVDVCCGGDGAPTEGYPVGSGTFLLRNAAPRHWDVTVPIGCDWGASKMAKKAALANKKSGVPTAQEQTRKERAAKAEALLHSTNLSAYDVIGDAVCALFENWVGLGLDFSQEDMPHFRQLIALSLLNKEFLK